MDGKNTWAWAAGILIVIVIIAALIWWNKKDQDAAALNEQQNASSTDQQAKASVAREDRTADSVADIIANLPEASTFASLFTSTGVAASISPTGKYTIFVPTNGAFNLLTPGMLAKMTAAQDKRLVQYHVVSGKKLDIDAINNGTITALSKDPLNFMVSDGGQSVQVNSAYAIKSFNAKNGIVYLVSGVLLPPEKAAY